MGEGIRIQVEGHKYSVHSGLQPGLGLSLLLHVGNLWYYLESLCSTLHHPALSHQFDDPVTLLPVPAESVAHDAGTKVLIGARWGEPLGGLLRRLPKPVHVSDVLMSTTSSPFVAWRISRDSHETQLL